MGWRRTVRRCEPGLTQFRRQCPPTGPRVFPDQLLNEGDVFGGDDSASVLPRGGHALVWQSGKWNASAKRDLSSLHYYYLCAHPPPHRRSVRIRVAGHQQHLCLMGFQHPRGLVAARPPRKTPVREPLLRQPEPLPVIDQDTDRRAAPAAEEKQASRERIRLQFLLAQSAKESMPFLPSTASIATRMRIWGVIWITSAPTTPGSARRDPARWSLSTGYASCRAALLTR